MFAQCVIGAILAGGSFFLPESPRYMKRLFPIISLSLTVFSMQRWLVDTDRDSEGMRVIADLHGGDLDDPIAKAEFREIKDKVVADVCDFLNAVMGLSDVWLLLASIWARTNILAHVEKIQTESIACHVVTSFCAASELVFAV